MSIPANPTEKPSIAKVWRQAKGNAWTFVSVWGLISMTSAIDSTFSTFLYQTAQRNGHHTFIALFIAIIGSLPTTLLSGMARMLATAVPVIYYTTDRCPKVSNIITRKPLRLLLAVFLFLVASIIGYLLCIIPGICVALGEPLYVYYVFTTDLNLLKCFGKMFKAMFQNFRSFFVVSLLSLLGSIILIIMLIITAIGAIIAITAIGAIIAINQMLTSVSSVPFFFIVLVSLGFALPVLIGISTTIILSMRELYMQNYIHYKGLVRARELA